MDSLFRAAMDMSGASMGSARRGYHNTLVVDGRAARHRSDMGCNMVLTVIAFALAASSVYGSRYLDCRHQSRKGRRALCKCHRFLPVPKEGTADASSDYHTGGVETGSQEELDYRCLRRHQELIHDVVAIESGFVLVLAGF